MNKEIFIIFNHLLVIILILGVVVSGTEDVGTCNDDNKKLLKISELWSKGPEEAISFLSGIYEHSSWVAETLIQSNDDYKSITSVTALANAMKSIVDKSTETQKLALLRAHPDLAQKVDALASLTVESQQEQTSAGLQSMTVEEKEEFTRLNDLYKQTFQFPFILAVRHATKYTVLSALRGRVQNHSYQVELVTALEQVHKIAWMRILSKFESEELYKDF